MLRTLLITAVPSVGAVSRRLQEEKETPFIETSGFIGVCVAAGVLLSCFLCCCYQTVSKRKWVNELRIELESKSKVAMTAKG